MKMTSAGPDYRNLQSNAPSAYKAAIERIPAVTAEEPDEE